MSDTHTILISDIPGWKPLPPAKVIHSLLDGHQVICVSSLEAVKSISAHNKLDVYLTNAPDYTCLQEIRRSHPRCQNILTTDQPMRSYSSALQKEEDVLLDHIISARSQGTWTEQEIKITIDKILHPQKIFGIERYLSPGTLIQRHEVRGSKDRDTLNNRVMEFAIGCRLGQHTSKMAFGITEELLMNTIHDAPLAAGLVHYANQPRTSPVELQPEEYGELTYACDGRTFAIASSDPFGALRREKLFQYLKKVLRRKDSIGIIDTKKGGAGLGFFKILYSSHGLVCNVAEGQRTEIMALIDLEAQLRDFAHMSRSIHYFTA